MVQMEQITLEGVEVVMVYFLQDLVLELVALEVAES